ncbi:hypothetical protein [Bacillus alkalicellulosilyticus]|nr:hypothetical protein [Bacillus alkalicellulosilyticus]
MSSDAKKRVKEQRNNAPGSQTSKENPGYGDKKLTGPNRPAE